MSKRISTTSVLLAAVVCLSVTSVRAAGVTINTLGSAPFQYAGRNYVPLKTTAGFLRAPLRYDAAKRQSVLSYRGKDLAVRPNSRQAVLAGRPVVLSSAPRVVNGVTYIPADDLKKYCDVGVVWDRDRSEVRIKGPDGWGTMKTDRRYGKGGPPPWAPAWGRRGNGTPGNSNKARSKGRGDVIIWDGGRNAGRNEQGNGKSTGNGKSRGNGKAKGGPKGR